MIRSEVNWILLDGSLIERELAELLRSPEVSDSERLVLRRFLVRTGIRPDQPLVKTTEAANS